MIEANFHTQNLWRNVWELIQYFFDLFANFKCKRVESRKKAGQLWEVLRDSCYAVPSSPPNTVGVADLQLHTKWVKGLLRELGLVPESTWESLSRVEVAVLSSTAHPRLLGQRLWKGFLWPEVSHVGERGMKSQRELVWSSLKSCPRGTSVSIWLDNQRTRNQGWRGS